MRPGPLAESKDEINKNWAEVFPMTSFVPYRRLGVISSETVPPVLSFKGSSCFLTAYNDESFQIYNCADMSLLFVGPMLDMHKICKLFAYADFTFTILDNSILAIFERAREIHRMSLPDTSPVIYLHTLGNFLFCAQECGNFLIYDLEMNFKLVSVHKLQLERDDELIVSVVHPLTYTNKLLITTTIGRMFLYNFNTKKIIFEFRRPDKGYIYGCQNSPVVDLVACISSDPYELLLRNIKNDTTLLALKLSPYHDNHRKPVYSFRTDEHSHLAISNADNSISIWNLDNQKLIQRIPGAHSREILFLEYLPGQPILLSCAADNSIKQWIFEGVEQSPRLLISRSGDEKPPIMVRFYGLSSHFLLSASKHSLRKISTRKDSQSIEFSKKTKSLSDQLIEIETASFDHAREKDWDNIVSCTTNSNVGITWNYLNASIGKHRLVTRDKGNITACLLSPCGHFALVATQFGNVDVFNIQSGIYQHTLNHELSSPIICLGMDYGNRTLVSVYSCGVITRWKYRSRIIDASVTVSEPIVKACYCADTNFLAIVTDTWRIIVYDVDTMSVGRIFTGHSAKITDLIFSTNGKQLVSASEDLSIRTWDVVGGVEVDCLICSEIPSSVALSPLGDYLAVCLVGLRGIFLYANLSFFGNSIETPFLERETSGFWQHGPTSFGTAVLSDVKGVFWQRLLNWERIKQKSKPVNPPSAPKQAPFFLDFSSKPSDTPPSPSSESEKAVNRPAIADELVMFSSNLVDDSDFLKFHLHFKAQQPSAIDLQLRCLSTDRDVKLFMQYLLFLARFRLDFDLAQVFLHVFLETHRDILINVEYEADISAILQSQTSEWGTLEDLFQETLCLVQFSKSR